ncbi:MAG: TolC family protein [Planctomycetota bacterium]|nr:MAG: TolC family protein [Planctomycetota bacterium]
MKSKESDRGRSILRRGRAVVLAFLLATGCSLSHQVREEVHTAFEQRFGNVEAEAAPYAQVPVQHEEGEEAEASSPALQPARSLRDYLVLALKENPDIKAARETVRARAERVRQVTALPDPFLQTKTLPEPVRTAEGDNPFVLGISQKLPVPAKLDEAGRIALQETRMAIEALQQTRLRVLADVKRTYFRLYVLDRSIEITEANQSLLQGLIDVARTQVAAGRRTQDDVLRAQVELSNLEAELIDLRQRRITAAARLNELLDRSPDEPIPSPEDFDIRRVDLTLDDLFARAEKANPELKRVREQIERDRHGLKLAKLASWPDFSIGFEWILMDPRKPFKPPINLQTGRRPPFSRLSEAATDNWAINVGLSLPIWFDKIQGGIEEARRKLEASRYRYRSARNRIHFQIEDALERVRSQESLARLFRDTIIPQAEQTYRVSQASYSAGTSDFLDVIDNWRKWLVFSIQYYRLLGELERSLADLEQAVGLSLSDTGAP